MVRAKLRVMNVENEYGNTFRVKFDCEYDGELPEDQRFCEATPWGHMEMGVTNPAALEQFQVGKVFYVDFTEVPET